MRKQKPFLRQPFLIIVFACALAASCHRDTGDRSSTTKPSPVPQAPTTMRGKGFWMPLTLIPETLYHLIKKRSSQ